MINEIVNGVLTSLPITLMALGIIEGKPPVVALGLALIALTSIVSNTRRDVEIRFHNRAGDSKSTVTHYTLNGTPARITSRRVPEGCIEVNEDTMIVPTFWQRAVMRWRDMRGMGQVVTVIKERYPQE